jgi:hypothetical protein
MIQGCKENADIDLQAKRMRKMVLAFIILTCPILCQAQTAVGLEISSLLFKEVQISLEHRIAEHWSVSAHAGMSLKALKRHMNSEETSHNESFPASSMPQERAFSHRECLNLRYWPQSTFNGIFISLGGEYKADAGPDANLGIGYMFSIWKGFKGAIRYETGMIMAAKNDKLSPEGLSIGIYWNL